MNCGEQLPNGAKFCVHCGTKLGNTTSNISIKKNVTLVPAKCTNCGGTLEVNPNEQTAECSYCNSIFVVEQAIASYNIQLYGNVQVGNATININGTNTQNLLDKAMEFENVRRYDSALKYYNKVLSTDVTNTEAKAGIERVNRAIENYVFFRITIPCLFSKDEILEVRKNYIAHIKSNGTINYGITEIQNVREKMGGVLAFDLPGKRFGTIALVTGKQTTAIVNFILSAQQGFYPKFD